MNKINFIGYHYQEFWIQQGCWNTNRSAGRNQMPGFCNDVILESEWGLAHVGYVIVILDLYSQQLNLMNTNTLTV